MASTIWRGYISFGLISIPVRLFRAARAERVSLRKLYRDAEPTEEPALAPDPEPRPTRHPRSSEDVLADATLPAAVSRTEPAYEPPLQPVQQASVLRGSDQALPSQSVVKGYEYEKNKFVVVEEAELKQLAPKTSSGMEIEEFVSLPDIDPVYFETSYYVVPEEAGQKAYALLYRAMQTTHLVAIAQFAMHGRGHVAVLRPGKRGMLAHTMFYESEVRADEEYQADSKLVTDKELSLAETLIASLTTAFEPQKYRDQYREALESMIANKVKGQPTMPITSRRSADVVDIAEALRRSLASLKKPAGSSDATATSAPPTGTKRTRRTAGG